MPELLPESVASLSFPVGCTFSADTALGPSSVHHCFLRSFVPTELAMARFVFIRYGAHPMHFRMKDHFGC